MLDEIYVIGLNDLLKKRLLSAQKIQSYCMANGRAGRILTGQNSEVPKHTAADCLSRQSSVYTSDEH